MAGVPTFGKEMRELFMMSPYVTPINHAGWGTLPLKVFEARVRLLKVVESEVDTYFRYKWEEMWFDNLKVTCKFLGMDVKNTTFVPNTTTGINTVLKTLPLTKEDVILTHTYTYASVIKAAKSATARVGAKVIKVDLDYNIQSREKFIDWFTQALDTHPKVTIAIIDYIGSTTATVYPVKELCAICRERGIISVVDAAHVPGQIKMNNIKDIKPDFLAGNLHKWSYTPRATAILWIAPKYQDIVRPLVTSHYYKLQPFQKDYSHQATIDNTMFHTVKDGLEFYKEIGGFEVVHKYITTLLDEAVEYLVKLWGTEKLPIPRDMEAPYMRLVRLPSIPKYPVPKKAGGAEKTYPLMDYLILNKKMNVVMIPLTSTDGTIHMWTRLSGQIYNTLKDYQTFGEEILRLSKE